MHVNNLKVFIGYEAPDHQGIDLQEYKVRSYMRILLLLLLLSYAAQGSTWTVLSVNFTSETTTITLHASVARNTLVTMSVATL